MKAIAINGSARVQGSTAALLKHALSGAEEAGAKTRFVNLYEIQFSGCQNCFECKRLGNINYGKCNHNDELTELLEDVKAADALFLGSPMYYGQITGEMQSFIERMLFPNILYDDNGGSLWPKKTQTAFFFTMNVNQQQFNRGHRLEALKPLLKTLEKVCGSAEYKLVMETCQFFDGYEKYYTAKFDGPYRLKRHHEVFPIELQEAFLMGKRMCMEPTNETNLTANNHYKMLNKMLGETIYDVKEPESIEYYNPGYIECGISKFKDGILEYRYQGK